MKPDSTNRVRGAAAFELDASGGGAAAKVLQPVADRTRTSGAGDYLAAVPDAEHDPRTAVFGDQIRIEPDLFLI